MDPFRVYTNGWELNYPMPAGLTFAVPATPQAISVALGGSLALEGLAQGGEGAIFYQWLHNGVLIPGKTSRQLVIPNVALGNAGNYTLRARTNTETKISYPFNVTVTPTQQFNFFDYFDGLALDAAKWNLEPGAAVSIYNAMAVLSSGGNWTRGFNTQGKFTRQSNNWIVEFRMKRSNVYDGIIEITDGNNTIQIEDSTYTNGADVGSGFRLSTNGIFGQSVQTIGEPTTNFMEYRVTINGTNVLCERGNSLDSISQSISQNISVPIETLSLWIRCRNGGNNQVFLDWIRVR